MLDLNVKFAWTSLVLVTPLYVFLYMYLDAILPNIYGIRQGCCFCLRKKKKPALIEDNGLDEEVNDLVL